MGLEAATYINQLIGTNPTGSDPASSSDDHHRLVKNVLLNTFPNLNAPVLSTPAELTGRAPLASPAFTGVPTAPIATAGTRSAQLATMDAFGTELPGIPGAGWQKLPSGLILQWGYATTNGFGYAVVTFPIAFPFLATNAWATVPSSIVGYIAVPYGLAQGGMEVKVWSNATTNAPANFFWCALGY